MDTVIKYIMHALEYKIKLNFNLLTNKNNEDLTERIDSDDDEEE